MSTLQDNPSGPIWQELLKQAQEAQKLGAGPLRERIAIPHPLGGYRVVVREISLPPALPTWQA